MGLTYRGISLSPWSADTADWIENNVNVRDFYQLWSRLYAPTADLSFLAFPGVLPDGPGGGRMKLGKLWWPRGASRFASIHLLVDDVQLLALRGGSPSNALGAPYPFVMSWEDAAAGGVTVASVITDLMALPPLPLERIGGANGLSLLTLVDDRWNWWLRAEGILRIAERVTTWQMVYAELATALGVTLNVDTIPAAYLYPSALFSTNYEYVPLLLDAVAYAVGQRITRQLDGTVRARNFASSLTDIAGNLTLPSARSLVAGGLVASNDVLAITAGTLAVSFSQVSGGSTLPNPYVVSAPTGGTSPGTKSLHGMIVYDGGNSSQLAALVAQMALDYAAQFQGGGTWKYAGIVPWTPEAIDDGIEWTLTLLGGQQGDGEISTRIYPPSWNDLTDMGPPVALVAGQPCDCPAPVTIVNVTNINQIVTNNFSFVFNQYNNVLYIYINGCFYDITLSAPVCPSGVPTGPGTPSGTGCTPGACDLCGVNAPNSWLLSLTSFQGDCAVFNGNGGWRLTNTGNCIWAAQSTVGGIVVRVTLILGANDVTLTFTRTDNNLTASYNLGTPPSMNCCLPLALRVYQCPCPDTTPTGPMGCGCSVVPDSFGVTLSGFSGCLAGVNGATLSLQPQGSGLSCCWGVTEQPYGAGTITALICLNSVGTPSITFNLIWYPLGVASDPATIGSAYYTGTIPGDCCADPLTLSLANPSGSACGGIVTAGVAPATLAFHPVCTGGASTTGGSTGGDTIPSCPPMITATPVCCSGSGSGTGTGGVIVTGCCPFDLMPLVLHITLTGGISDSFTLTSGGVAPIWTGTRALCGGLNSLLTLSCVYQIGVGYEWVLKIDAVDMGACTAPAKVATSANCNPVLFSFNMVGGGGCCNLTAFTAVITG